MAGKIIRSPFNERCEHHTITKLSKCQRFTRYPHHIGWEVVYTGGTEKQQQASNWVWLPFMVPNKIKPMTFQQLFGINKRLVRKSLLIPKNKHGFAWVNKSYATALDFNLGYYTIEIGLRRIQNLYHHPFFLGTRMNDGNNRFSWQANCWSLWNPKRMYEFALGISSASLKAVLRTK